MEDKLLSTARAEARKNSCFRLRHYISQTSNHQSLVSGPIPRENYRGAFWTECPDFQYLMNHINQSSDVAITCENGYITHIDTHIDARGKVIYKLYNPS
jgi:hypothetical protein